MTQVTKDKCIKEDAANWSRLISQPEYSKLDEEPHEDTPVVVVEMSPLKIKTANYGTLDDADRNDKNGTFQEADQILRSSVQIPWYKKNMGLIYVLLSVFCVCCLNITVKVVSKSDERLPILELVLIRGCVGSLVVMIMMLQQNVAHWFGSPEVVRLLLARGIFGFLALTFNFFAVSLLSVGDATILSFFAPVFAGLLGSIFLKEQWDAVDKLAGFFSMIGVIFIARPPFLFGSYSGGVDDAIFMPDDASIPAIVVDSENSDNISVNSTTIGNITEAMYGLYRRNSVGKVPDMTDSSIEAELIRLGGVIMALLSACCVAVALILIRKLNKRADPLNVVFYFHWMLIPFALIFAPMVPKSMDSSSWMIPQKMETWSVVFLGIVFGTASQFFMTKGLQTETVARASSMNYTQVIFAFSSEWILWGIAPTTMTVFGVGIIIASMVFSAIYKNRGNK